MEALLTGLAMGALAGVVAGFLLGIFESLTKDLRDSRLIARGWPLPSDRVFPRYHWFLGVLGAVQGVGLTAFDVPPLWAGLSVLAFAAIGLLLLAWEALAGGRIPSRPRFDPGTLVGQEVAEAVRIARESGWLCDVADAPTDSVSPRPEAWVPLPRAPRVRIDVRDGRVTGTRVVSDSERTA